MDRLFTLCFAIIVLSPPSPMTTLPAAGPLGVLAARADHASDAARIHVQALILEPIH
jgi:hypothetical protein